MTLPANIEGEGDEQFLPYGPPTEVDERPPLARKSKGEQAAESLIEDETESLPEELMDDLTGCPCSQPSPS